MTRNDVLPVQKATQHLRRTSCEVTIQCALGERGPVRETSPVATQGDQASGTRLIRHARGVVVAVIGLSLLVPEHG